MGNGERKGKAEGKEMGNTHREVYSPLLLDVGFEFIHGCFFWVGMFPKEARDGPFARGGGVGHDAGGVEARKDGDSRGRGR